MCAIHLYIHRLLSWILYLCYCAFIWCISIYLKVINHDLANLNVQKAEGHERSRGTVMLYFCSRITNISALSSKLYLPFTDKPDLGYFIITRCTNHSHLSRQPDLEQETSKVIMAPLSFKCTFVVFLTPFHLHVQAYDQAWMLLVLYFYLSNIWHQTLPSKHFFLFTKHLVFCLFTVTLLYVPFIVQSSWSQA